MLGTLDDQSIHLRQKSFLDETKFAGLELRPVWSGVAIDPISLTFGRYTFGSDSDCDVSLSFPGVEERHCLMIVGRKRVIVQSFSRLTWINDGAVTEGEIRNGDRLIVGPLEFEVHFLTEMNFKPEVKERFSPPGIEHFIQRSLQLETQRHAQPFSRREKLLEEMLEDVQGMLDQLLQRDKASRQEIQLMNRSLADAQFELEQEFGFLSVQKSELNSQQQQLERDQEQLNRIDAATKQLNTLKRELEEQAARVSRQQSVLKPHRIQLLTEAELIGQQQRQLRQTHEKLEKARQQFEFSSVRTEELEAQRTELNARRDELSAQAEQLQIDKENLKSQKVELEQQSRKFIQKSSEVESQFEELMARQESCRQLEERLEQQRIEFASSEKEQFARLAEVESLYSELETERVQFQQIKVASEEELTNNALHIQKLEEQLALRTEQIAAEEQRLAEFQEAFSRQQEALQREAEELNQQRDTLGVERDAFLEHQFQFHQEYDELTHRQSQEKAEFEKQVQKFQAEKLRVDAIAEDLEDRRVEFHLWISDLENEKGELKIQSDLLTLRSRELEETQALYEQQKHELDDELLQLAIEKESLRLQRSELNLEADAIGVWSKEIELEQMEVEKLVAEQSENHEAWLREKHAAEEELLQRQSEFSIKQGDFAELESRLAEKEEELNQKLAIADSEKGTLCELKDSLYARKQQLQEEEDRLQGVQQELDSLNKEQQAQFAVVQAHQAELEQQAVNLKEREDELAAIRTESATELDNLKRKTADVLAQEAELTKTISDLEERRVKLEVNEAKCQSARDDFELERKEFSLQIEALKLQEKQLEERELQLSEAQLVFEKQQELLGYELANQGVAVNQQVQFEIESQRLKELELEILDRQHRLDRWQREIEDREQERIRETAEEIETQLAEVTLREKKLNEREEDLSTREAILRTEAESSQIELEAQIHSLTEQLNAVTSEKDQLLELYSTQKVDAEKLQELQTNFQGERQELEHRIEVLQQQLHSVQQDQLLIEELRTEIAAEKKSLFDLKEHVGQQFDLLQLEYSKLETQRLQLIAEQEQLLENKVEHSTRASQHAVEFEESEDFSQAAGQISADLTEDKIDLNQQPSWTGDDALDSLLSYGSIGKSKSIKNADSSPDQIEDSVAHSIEFEEMEKGDSANFHEDRRMNSQTLEDEVGDEVASDLRQNLAEIFGIHSSVSPTSEVDQLVEPASQAPEFKGIESASNEQEIAQSEEIEGEEYPEPPQDVQFDFSEGGEDAVQRYMEQLLARTRSHREENRIADKQERENEAAAISVLTTSDSMESELEETPELLTHSSNSQKVRKIKRTEERSHAQIRENLNSFRKVANTSARSALAKSSLSRQRAAFKTFIVFTCASLFCTVFFSMSGLWSGVSYKEFAVASGLISVVLCVYLSICLMKIKQLEIVENGKLAEDLAASNNPETL